MTLKKHLPFLVCNEQGMINCTNSLELWHFIPLSPWGTSWYLNFWKLDYSISFSSGPNVVFKFPTSLHLKILTHCQAFFQKLININLCFQCGCKACTVPLWTIDWQKTVYFCQNSSILCEYLFGTVGTEHLLSAIVITVLLTKCCAKNLYFFLIVVYLSHHW